MFGKPVAMSGSHMTGALNVPAIANRVELPAKKNRLSSGCPTTFSKKTSESRYKFILLSLNGKKNAPHVS